MLRPRITLDDDLIGRMEAQHGEIAAAVADVRRWLPGWAASADPETGEKIAARIETATGILSVHLAEEEERILPLVAEHFSQREWDALGKHGFAAIPGKRPLVMLGHILQETDEAERQRFMRQVPPPARLAYSLVGRRQYARETAVIHG